MSANTFDRRMKMKYWQRIAAIAGVIDKPLEAEASVALLSVPW